MFGKIVASLLISTSQAGWCDNWGILEWSDEFDGNTLDRTKWNVVCNDISEAGCDMVPFVTHATSNGAECRSATCISSNVAVNNGYGIFFFPNNTFECKFGALF